MLENLTRSVIIVAPQAVPRRAAAPASTFLPAPVEQDERSLDNLAALADLAYKAGDRVLAEHCVRRLYALYDRKAARAMNRKSNEYDARRRAGRLQDKES